MRALQDPPEVLNARRRSKRGGRRRASPRWSASERTTSCAQRPKAIEAGRTLDLRGVLQRLKVLNARRRSKRGGRPRREPWGQTDAVLNARRRSKRGGPPSTWPRLASAPRAQRPKAIEAGRTSQGQRRTTARRGAQRPKAIEAGRTCPSSPSRGFERSGAQRPKAIEAGRTGGLAAQAKMASSCALCSTPEGDRSGADWPEAPRCSPWSSMRAQRPKAIEAGRTRRGSTSQPGNMYSTPEGDRSGADLSLLRRNTALM